MAAHPRPMLAHGPPAEVLAALRRLVAEHDIERLVVGLPLNMDGSEGPMAKEARAFGERLARELALPLLLEDERLSTDEAESVLLGAGLRPSDRKRARDSVAAAVILTAVLERERAGGGS